MRPRMAPARKRRCRPLVRWMALLGTALLLASLLGRWGGARVGGRRPPLANHVRDTCALVDGGVRCSGPLERAHLGSAVADSGVAVVRTVYESKWSARPHLVVLGVLVEGGLGRGSGSTDARASRRAQRETWGALDGVARRANDFSGPLLLLYVRPFSTDHPAGVSPAVVAEMEAWEDTLLVDADGRARAALAGGPLPLQRLSLLFYLYAVGRLEGCPFVASAVKDSFVYVPEFLRTVRHLPRVSLLYGRVRRPVSGAGAWSVSGPIVVATHDVAEEVAAGVLVSGHVRWAGAVARTESPCGPVLFALYGNESRGRRAAAALPPRPWEGWGGAYARFMEAPGPDREVGFAALSDGSYNVSVQLPWHGTFDPARIVFAADNCRLPVGPPSPAAPVRGAVAIGRVSTESAARAALEALRAADATGALPRPRKVDFLAGTGYSYYVRFMVDVCRDDQLEVEYGRDRFPVPLA